ADRVGALVRNEAAAELRVRLVRRDRLAARALVAAPHAVHLERRTYPLPFQRGVARFAERHRRAHLREETAFVERQLGDGATLLFRHRRDVVVEPRDGDSTVGYVLAGVYLGH